ncbi:acyl-protein synthetase [Paenibacillus oenotherae]|uniref:Acyl-protein synthetase n=1 Tax=Paenibacillus oenotherae TaxID=1435645 RepID=A0ABS7D536_9BACL|nr:acyl-protein synthetase [Paenibacillus oenotherae]MBW7475054.1 acyl-protein synthetase [Paenibacillus oenotherae]
MTLEQLFQSNPYEMKAEDKKKMMFQEISSLTKLHRERCEPYENINKALPAQHEEGMIEDLPFLPVRLFKLAELRSVEKEAVIKTLTSSGTTSQVVSRIFLDKETSLFQTKALVTIVKSYLGNQRLPMIIVDSPNVIKDRTSFSARGAGIMGLINFGRNHFYLLNESMEINWEGLEQFLEAHKGQEILLFGFTFMVWKYFYKAALEQNKKISLGKSILIHSGGWKKLLDEAVDNETFKSRIKDQLGIERIHNFYGMVEQVGSIFMECEHGRLHTPSFADLLVRDPQTLEVLPNGEQGIIQVMSLLPRSYPGHNLLTEDLGTILGEDNCPCGRHGKSFVVHGRLPAAELRGCSDTHAFDSGGNNGNTSSQI